MWLNHWNRWFFDSLEARDVDGLTSAVLVFALIIVAMAAVGVGIVITREMLQVHWRAWIVEHLVDRWLSRQRFYHLNVTGKEPPNPEYRISDDTRWATEPLVDLGIGLVLAVVGAAAFISILWTVGGSYTLELGSLGPVTIPAYMVIAALAYGIIASGLMMWVGAPLVGFVGRKNEAEGYFRFAMMRIRDNAESVALMNGARYEQAVLGRFYETVVARWMAIVWQHGHLTWITNASGPMIPIIPLLFAAPKYISGELTLGQVKKLDGRSVRRSARHAFVFGRDRGRARPVGSPRLRASGDRLSAPPNCGHDDSLGGFERPPRLLRQNEAMLVRVVIRP